MPNDLPTDIEADFRHNAESFLKTWATREDKIALLIAYQRLAYHTGRVEASKAAVDTLSAMLKKDAQL